ncbi:murein transglycosylase [Cryobacterium sp. TMT1-21]|uniref:Murein transglycosylase n=1 Tax=Cryobacterium shii TaxID=1259235 RepID=A0AAQ2C4J7_9MICO|nr:MULTISPECIES: lytic transglycosylase domain-containing protein [Cryobacterium]TFC42576.1 murein transglycosylase [Cryobacterium shii]TFD15564.1 murein transglycosylase [Cryobacterium sp. TMT1-21]TFD36690.1 murein transglycosylase [Cryobacterium sp. TMT2-10]
MRGLGGWWLFVAFLALAGWLVFGWLAHGHAPVPARAAPSLRLEAAAGDTVAPAAPTQPPLAGSATAASVVASVSSDDASLVSVPWAQATSEATGIGYRALLGYAGASLAMASRQPSCHLGWTTLAALGAVESGHGTHAGSSVDADGVVRPGIYGPLLDGTALDAFADTDGGRWDGNAQWDRAVGPLQFIPSTWQRWGADGNGDGINDPQQVDDAALATGLYLCYSGDLSAAGTWQSAIFSYNHLESYVDAVAGRANAYAAQVD